MTTTTNRLRPGWELWADWCAATGRTSLDVNVEALDAYARQVARPQLPDVRATCHEVGIPWPHEPAPADPWRAVEDQMLDLDESLARCPVLGWPTGFRGRRDAWLLVLTRGLRMSRAAAVSVGVEDLSAIWERLTGSLDPARCHRCVAVRWLDVVETQASWSWWVTREMLMSRPTSTDEHVCGDGLPLPSFPVGPEALAPRIDRYGGVTLGAPLTKRSVTAVLALRCTTLFEAGSESDLGAGLDREAEDVGPVRAFDASTFERLDEACDAADAVNDRVAALLAETAAQLRLA